MAVTTTYTSSVTSVETISTNVPAAASTGRTVTHNGFNTAATLTASTTPPVTTPCYFEKALSAGSGTIDLTSLTGTNGIAVTMSGLKVQVCKFKAKADNAGTVTLTEGASNGYELAGNTWKVALAPGQEFLFYGNDATPDVGGSAKTIDLSGTGTDTLECSIVAG